MPVLRRAVVRRLEGDGRGQSGTARRGFSSQWERGREDGGMRKSRTHPVSAGTARRLGS